MHMREAPRLDPFTLYVLRPRVLDGYQGLP